MVLTSGLYMLDTNTVSYLATDRSGAARERLLQVRRDARIVLSAVTEGEIRFGLAKNPEAARMHALLEGFLLYFPVLPWDSAAAQTYGILRAQAARSGQMPGPLDLLIGAHAHAIGATLVSHDRAVLCLCAWLSVEDWATDL